MTKPKHIYSKAYLRDNLKGSVLKGMDDSLKNLIFVGFLACSMTISLQQHFIILKSQSKKVFDRGGRIVDSILAFNSGDPSSNPGSSKFLDFRNTASQKH